MTHETLTNVVQELEGAGLAMESECINLDRINRAFRETSVFDGFGARVRRAFDRLAKHVPAGEDDWKERAFWWRIVLRFDGRTMALDYWSGQAHCSMSGNSVRPNRPGLADVVSCLVLDGVVLGASFSDWCADFGYSDDSIQAFNTYREGTLQADRARTFFGRQWARLASAENDV